MTILKVATNNSKDFIDPKFLQTGSVLTEWRGKEHAIVEYFNPVDKPGLDGESIKVEIYPEPITGGILTAQGMPDLYVVTGF